MSFPPLSAAYTSALDAMPRKAIQLILLGLLANLYLNHG
jgi:hypothetical protein